MRVVLLGSVLLAFACTRNLSNPGQPGDDGGIFEPDLSPSVAQVDMKIAEVDMTTAPVDMAAAVDSATAIDLSVLDEGLDQSSGDDLAVVPDLATRADLTTLPDLTPAPDLTPPPGLPCNGDSCSGGDVCCLSQASGVCETSGSCSGIATSCTASDQCRGQQCCFQIDVSSGAVSGQGQCQARCPLTFNIASLTGQTHTCQTTSDCHGSNIFDACCSLHGVSFCASRAFAGMGGYTCN